MSDNSWCYVFLGHGSMYGKLYEFMNPTYRRTGFCAWCKPNPMPSLAKTSWTFADDLCMYGKKGKPVFNYPDGTHALNFWLLNKHSDGLHPTQKTIEVIEHIIKHCSVGGSIVNDFFNGSGTTIIAAENLSRQCRAVEISPAYVAVALQRYQDAFGITPELITE